MTVAKISCSKRLTDRQRLLKTFISIITDDNKNTFSREELREIIAEDFDVKFTAQEIDEYFEPNVEDVKKDLRQQMRNLSMIYD